MSVQSPRAWWVLALLALLAAPGAALACSCTWGGPFTKVALGTDLAGASRRFRSRTCWPGFTPGVLGESLRPVPDRRPART